MGYEDALLLPDGTPAPHNAALVEAARNIIAEAALAH
ncbi:MULTISPECIES: 3-keto-5-aminohexanoate cleavage protein [unclassified Streptomyces]